MEDDLLDVADAFFELDPTLGQGEPLLVDNRILMIAKRFATIFTSGA